MIVVYRGKHCPVSKNYLASLQQIIYELDELAVEVIAVSGDGRERAESFVSLPCSQGRTHAVSGYQHGQSIKNAQQPWTCLPLWDPVSSSRKVSHSSANCGAVRIPSSV